MLQPQEKATQMEAKKQAAMSLLKILARAVSVSLSVCLSSARSVGAM